MLSIGFQIFCWYRGFCHRSESDLLLFLFKHKDDLEQKKSRSGSHRNFAVEEI